MATPPSGPSGNTSEYEMSVATAPFAIFDELQVKGPEPPQYVHTNQMLKNYIPGLFDTYIFRHDNNTTKETWNRLLEMTEMISLKELKWVMNMISDVLKDHPHADSESIDRFKTFLWRNSPKNLDSCFYTQPQHTHQLCTLLESLHTRVSALEARRA